MPPHIIIIGAPIAIIELIASARSFMRGIIDESIGIIFIVMPSFVISQDILHIIGIMPAPIIGIIMGIMPFIGIIGIIMPFIMGIMPGPIIGIIGMLGMLFMGMAIIEPPLIIGMFMSSSPIELFEVRAFTERKLLGAARR